MELKLNAENKNEKRVLAYLEANASEMLAEKINSGDKTLRGCFKYMSEQAKEFAINNCACIDDETVFGWAVHYFEEDEIKEGSNPPPKPAPAVKHTEQNTVVKKEAKKQDDSQMSMFDLFDMGGANV